jgi:hypothetical protein
VAFLQLIPVLLSALLLSAHFLRGGHLLLVAFCLLVPLLLLIRRPWVPRAMQVGLVIGALEWVRTTIQLVLLRQEKGEDWTRMAIILGCVALVTGGSALVFLTQRLRRRYHPTD